MPQGKLKQKTKVPESVKAKQKGKPFTRRANAPIKRKKSKLSEGQKFKQMISKNLNQSVEDEIRQQATEGQKNFSNAQRAVAKHNKDSNKSDQLDVSAV